MLESTAELVPVPALRSVLGVAIKVIELCEVSISVVREYRANRAYYLVGSGNDDLRREGPGTTRTHRSTHDRDRPECDRQL